MYWSHLYCWTVTDLSLTILTMYWLLFAPFDCGGSVPFYIGHVLVPFVLLDCGGYVPFDIGHVLVPFVPFDCGGSVPFYIDHVLVPFVLLDCVGPVPLVVPHAMLQREDVSPGKRRRSGFQKQLFLILSTKNIVLIYRIPKQPEVILRNSAETTLNPQYQSHSTFS
jgi:hypothetical protein